MLPAWWADELAETPANRTLAEMYISRLLGFSLRELRDHEAELALPSSGPVKFKRYKNEVDDAVRTSALVAQRMASLFARAASEVLPLFAGPLTAEQVRDRVLARRPWVDLESLLELCWGLGIPVLQLDRVPARSKRFDGMAVWVHDRPAIVLASGRDGMAWLAFHIAHELGHVMLGHIGSRTEAWVDGSIAGVAGSSIEERAADEFACEVLTGFKKPQIPDQKATAPRLAVIASRTGPMYGIDPGVYVLIYAKSNDRWPVAQEALKHLDLAMGGKDLVARHASRVLARLELPEADERLLGVMKAA